MPPAAARAFVWLWLAGHLLYPAWLNLSPSLAGAAARFALFSAIGGVLLWRYREPFLRPPAGPDPVLAELLGLPKDPWLWMILGAAAAVRLYPLSLPAHYFAGGDESVHMGLPALPFKVWHRASGIPFWAAFWAAVPAALFWRRGLAARAAAAARALVEGRPVAALLACLLAAAYLVVSFDIIAAFARAGHASLPADILRFPPLSKFFRFASYAAFGVSYFTGRLPEFLLFFSAAILVYKLVDLRSGRLPARAAAALYVLLPPFAYYSMRGSQTNGENFFFVLVAYLFCLWTTKGLPGALPWAVVAVAAGSLYRYTLPLLGFVLPATALVAQWRRGPSDPAAAPITRRDAAEYAALLAAAIIPWMCIYLATELRPYGRVERVWGLELALTPAKTVAAAAGLPCALFFAAGALVALLRRRGGSDWHLFGWCAAYYLFVTLDLAGDIRIAMPMYTPLMIWAAEAPFALLGARAASALVIGLCAQLALVGTLVKDPRLPPEFNLKESLAREYVPLGEAGRYIGTLPGGTRILTVDCSRSCFSLYLKDPEAVEWTVADSTKFSSIGELEALCREKAIGVVMYVAGDPLAFGEPKNPRLFESFLASPRFETLAHFRRGANHAIFRRPA